MPNTYYRGDLSEVTMGHECGLYIEHGEPCTWTATWASGTPDYTTITFAGTSHSGNDDMFEASKPSLKVPIGMLIGTKMSFHGSATTGGFTDFYYTGMESRIYSIVDHTTDGTATSIKVVPALDQTASRASVAGDVLFIHSDGLPALSGGTTCTVNTRADTTKETSLIDQFIGLASFMTLPDTTVELHQYHVVGLGRQPSVMQPGRLNHTGGVIEMPIHSPRWLYYSLGREVVDGATLVSNYSGMTNGMKLGTSVQPGQTYVDVANSTGLAVGRYILIKDTTRAPTVYHKQADEASDDGTATSVYWPGGSGLTGGTASPTVHFESTETSEIRRIVAFTALSSGYRVHVDDPWAFAHDTSDVVEIYAYDTAASNGSPNVNTDRTITNAVRRLIFSGDNIPSFCMEHSIRNRDVGSYSQEDSSAPGGSTDTKQLTRVFRGCKISEYEISATTDAELRYRAVFDAMSVYTDTGRLETSNKGDRYTAHRMFQNIGDTALSRKESGIAEGSEKPFMFYNGTIEMFDQALANISAFEIRGKNGTELFHTIQGNPVPETTVSATDLRSTKQVPYGGTRSPSIHREGREEFEMEVDVYLSDPLLWTELRSHRQFKGDSGKSGGVIRLFFTKSVAGSTGSTPSLLIVVDDYVITEAPIPVPDDKGLLKSKVKLRMKNVKVISVDTLFHC